MASPFFRVLLGNIVDGEMELELDHKNPEEFALILAILHHRSDFVPRKVTAESLCGIATYCVMYGVRTSLAPWCKAWIDRLLPNRDSWRTVESQKRQLLVKWLCISYNVGSLKMFSKISLEVLKACVHRGDHNCKIGVDGCEDMGSKEFRTLPYQLRDALLEARSEYMNGVYDNLQKLREDYRASGLNYKDSKCEYKGYYGSAEWADKLNCDCMMLGVVERGLRRVGLMNSTSTIELDAISIEDLYKKLNAFLHSAHEGVSERDRKIGTHECCRQTLKPKLNPLMSTALDKYHSDFVRSMEKWFKDQCNCYAMDEKN
ncbi:hypothetical protein DFH27DRAFT_611184 [Peziza echinospora]|nr:hypothetical protein DFH27DRAFT_611184 [Peziza echinospora]